MGRGHQENGTIVHMFIVPWTCPSVWKCGSFVENDPANHCLSWFAHIMTSSRLDPDFHIRSDSFAVLIDPFFPFSHFSYFSFIENRTESVVTQGVLFSDLHDSVLCVRRRVRLTGWGQRGIPNLISDRRKSCMRIVRSSLPPKNRIYSRGGC